VNGDGFSDVIVGAKFYNAGTVDEGIAQLYIGSAAGLAPGSSWVTEGNQFQSLYGWCVAGAGDVNGDGFGEVLVGSHLYYNGTSDEGMAFLFSGSAAM